MEENWGDEETEEDGAAERNVLHGKGAEVPETVPGAPFLRPPDTQILGTKPQQACRCGHQGSVTGRECILAAWGCSQHSKDFLDCPSVNVQFWNVHPRPVGPSPMPITPPGAPSVPVPMEARRAQGQLPSTSPAPPGTPRRGLMSPVGASQLPSETCYHMAHWQSDTILDPSISEGGVNQGQNDTGGKVEGLGGGMAVLFIV